MAVQAEVIKSGSENPLATIRKFSRRVQGVGLVKQLRARRYHSRNFSKTVRKKRALKMIKRRKDFQKAIKEGKIAEAPKRYQPKEQAPRPTTGTGLGESTPIAR